MCEAASDTSKPCPHRLSQRLLPGGLSPGWLLAPTSRRLRDGPPSFDPSSPSASAAIPKVLPVLPPELLVWCGLPELLLLVLPPVPPVLLVRPPLRVLQLWPSQVLLMQLWLTVLRPLALLILLRPLVLRPLALLILLRPLVLRRQFPAEMHQFPGLPGRLYDGVSSPARPRAGQVG